MPDQFDALAQRFGGASEGQRPGYDAPPASAEQFMEPPQPPDLRQGLNRFLSNAGEVLNPVTMLQGLGDLMSDPAGTITNMTNAQLGQGEIAKQRFGEGRYTEGAGHLAAGLFPIVGPMAAQAGEQIASGDVAGGLGKSAGLLLPAAAPALGRTAAKAVPNKVAGTLEEGAASRYADVMSPKVGANKVRFGNRAEKIAGTLASDPEMSAMSREGLHQKVQGRLASAEMGLDEAANARLSARTFKTAPIIADLMERRRRLTAEAAEASEFPATGKDTYISKAQETAGFGPAERPFSPPAGEDVVPGPYTDRAAVIDRAIAELKTLGPSARYESIRRIREAYDGPAKVKYSPATTTDYIKAQGGATGASDVTGVLREHLAKFDPETAAANADYSLYKTADDVMQATAEVQRSRPTVGRQIVARGTGAITGGQVGGPAGAVAGFALGPIVDAALSSGVTTKLKTAQLMSKLAQAIRGGNQAQATSLMSQLKRLGAQSLTITGLQEPPPMRVTTPSGSQMQPAEGIRQP